MLGLVAIQCTLQPLSLLVIPLSGLVMFPFAWAVAFFRNAGSRREIASRNSDARTASAARASGIRYVSTRALASAPRVTTNPGQPAAIAVNQDHATPDGSIIPLGVTLSITPTITEKGSIAFSGRATDRFKHGQREGESLSSMTFVARETYFKGVTESGSTVLLNGAPATSAAAKKDAAAPSKSRELVIYLTFKKVTTEEGTKKPPAKATNKKPSEKKSAPPVKKSSSSKTESSPTKKKKSQEN